MDNTCLSLFQVPEHVRRVQPQVPQRVVLFSRRANLVEDVVHVVFGGPSKFKPGFY